MHRITDEQRRARLAQRHALRTRAASVEEAARAMTCLHATEPPSVHLSLVARSDATREDVERALYAERTLVKQLAMRRTLFAFPRELLPAALGSASARVAQQQHVRLGKEVRSNGLADDGERWVEQQCADVLADLVEHGPSTTAELRERLPELARRLEVSPGKPYGGSFPVAARVLTVLAADGRVLRGDNAGQWRVSRPRWTLAEDWLGERPAPTSSEDGYLALVRAWLRTFGPGTETDVVWWLGATKTVVRRALAELGAVPVELDGGGEVGFVLPDDLDDVPVPEPWAALLPVLDPTTMGWKQRDFYLDPADVPYLFDTNGNGGTTAWWDGRVVGCWVQDADGTVRVLLRHDVGDEARAALDGEARRLGEWLAGDVVSTVYASLQMKSARLP